MPLSFPSLGATVLSGESPTEAFKEKKVFQFVVQKTRRSRSFQNHEKGRSSNTNPSPFLSMFSFGAVFVGICCTKVDTLQLIRVRDMKYQGCCGSCGMLLLSVPQ